MVDCSPATKCSEYRFQGLNKTGQAEEEGLFSLEFQALEDGFLVFGKKQYIRKDMQHEETFKTTYSSLNIVKNITIEGNVDGLPYFLSMDRKGDKIAIDAKLVQGNQQLSVKTPSRFFESNSFMFLLPSLLGNKQKENYELFYPTSASFMETKASRYSHVEQVTVPAGTFACYRIKLEACYNQTANQYLVYCGQSNRLIKGSSVGQIFELVK